MPDPAIDPTRRAFLGNALKLGTGSLLVGASLRGAAPAEATGPARNSAVITTLLDLPTRVFIDHDGTRLGPTDRQGSRFTSDRAAAAAIRPAISRPRRPQRHRALRFGRSADDRARAKGRFPRRHADRPVWRLSGRLRTARLAAHHDSAGMAFRRGASHLPLGGVRRGRPAAGVEAIRNAVNES